MSNSQPKFYVGQKVAVCSGIVNPPARIIPQTVVTALEFQPAGWYFNAKDRCQFFDEGWAYQVEDPIPTAFGTPCWYEESCLRPLNDDDYEEERRVQEGVYDDN